MAIRPILTKAREAFRDFLKTMDELRREQRAEYESAVRKDDETKMRKIRETIDGRGKT